VLWSRPSVRRAPDHHLTARGRADNGSVFPGRPKSTLWRMSAKWRVPTYLQASTDAGGPARVEWLAALPDRVEELTTRWGLDLGEPFDPGGNCSWVAPGTDRSGREVVLKVAWWHTEARHEAEGLAALGGQGAAEMYAFEHLAPARTGGGPPGAVDTTAMLLERCRPGTELRGRPEAEQHVVIADLLRAVWAVGLPSDHPFRPLSVLADDWVGRAEARLAALPGLLDAGLARDGLALFRDLSRSGPTEVLLFTDLHAGNVLSGQRRPWLLIDPKPYVGDPHYDVLQHLLNCNESLQADPIGLLTEVADLAGLDARRVRQWLWARCVQETLGQGQGPAWPGLDVVLRRLSSW
jgi:streptomycin 6-kinase